VVGQVLKSSAPAEPRFREIDLVKLLAGIRELPEIAQRLERSNVKLIVDGRPEVIEGLKEELTEALVCLIENAIDAIEEKGASGGRIVIRIGGQPAGRQDQVEIVCQDNGCGIPANDLAKVFIPFYTTKSKGTKTLARSVFCTTARPMPVPLLFVV